MSASSRVQAVRVQEEDVLITLSFQATATADNIDFQEDTVDGKRTLHATMSVAYEERFDNDDVFQGISISQGADENTVASIETESLNGISSAEGSS